MTRVYIYNSSNLIGSKESRMRQFQNHPNKKNLFLFHLSFIARDEEHLEQLINEYMIDNYNFSDHQFIWSETRFEFEKEQTSQLYL